MSGEPETRAPVKVAEIIPSKSGEISAIASANAPFIYFDGAPTFGFNEGIANITLEAVRNLYAEGALVTDKVVVAHLRMSLPAMLRLKGAIEGALLLATPVEKPEGKKN